MKTESFLIYVYSNTQKEKEQESIVQKKWREKEEVLEEITRNGHKKVTKTEKNAFEIKYVTSNVTVQVVLAHSAVQGRMKV